MTTTAARLDDVGSAFVASPELTAQLDELVDLTRASGDTIAERMRVLGATPDGRSATVAARTGLPAYPTGEQHTTTVVRLVLGSATASVVTMRAVHDAVDAEDPTTSGLLHALIVGLEKQRWMLRRAARGQLSRAAAAKRRGRAGDGASHRSPPPNGPT